MSSRRPLVRKSFSLLPSPASCLLPSILLNVLARLVGGGRGPLLVVADARDFGTDEEVASARCVASAAAQGVCVDAVGGALRVRLRRDADREAVAFGDERVRFRGGLKDACLDELRERRVLSVALEVELLSRLYAFE